MMSSTLDFLWYLYLFLVGVSATNAFVLFSTPATTRTSFGSVIENKSNCRNVLFMSWGPDPIWCESEIKSNELANQSGGSISVILSAPAATTEDYKIPGQYIQVRKNEGAKPLFLAIASAPDENSQFEFLIKKTDDNAWMTDGNVEISQVLGNGFPMKDELDGLKYDFPCQNVLLFAAGSGIAPIKAAIESGALQTSSSGGRTARLYYGVRTEEDLCFVNRFKQWEASGIQVVPVLSQPSDSWKGRTGYVQNALLEDGVPVPRNTGVLLCGMKGMTEAVTDILTKAGTFEGRILTNF